VCSTWRPYRGNVHGVTAWTLTAILNVWTRTNNVGLRKNCSNALKKFRVQKLGDARRQERPAFRAVT
jgi:hypothetical protein